ncbi:hypothetical protein EV356DRAFT_573481 [Viridothelium virens]|uniref:Secreted protein NIS1 n=1 Tax=Viridothelium virens TaxID=1048519 RepID=A0A6A6HK22_VIRVR|nr:hypothetical protein EV356DRAFT_573481 [Viridothelium virens]
MRAQTLLAAGAALLTSRASAIISGFAVPSTIAAGQPFDVIVETADYIQTVQDVAISFGIAPPQLAHDSTLGTNLLTSQLLGPSKSNILTNITFSEEIPAEVAAGDYVVTAAVFSLYGVEYSPAVDYFTVNTTVGATTSETYVSSTPSS